MGVEISSLEKATRCDRVYEMTAADTMLSFIPGTLWDAGDRN
jgi:hypothetical protein